MSSLLKEIDNRPTSALTPKELRQLVYKLQDQVQDLKERRKPKERIIVRTSQEHADELKALKAKLFNLNRKLERYHKERETHTEPNDDAAFIYELTGVTLDRIREKNNRNGDVIRARIALCYMRRQRGDYTPEIGSFIDRDPSGVTKYLDVVQVKLDNDLLNKIDNRLNLNND